MISLTARGIATLVNFRLSNCIFYCCVKTRQHLVTTAVVDRISRQELCWIWITSVSVVMWQLWARVWNIRSSLEVYAIANVRWW
jgi:hypothetical protein